MHGNEEAAALEDVVDRLAGRFPDLPREHVAQVVHESHVALDGNPIRDFVPVLVESAAKKRLRTEAHPTTIPIAEDGAVAASAIAVSTAQEPPELDPLEIERMSRQPGSHFGEL